MQIEHLSLPRNGGKSMIALQVHGGIVAIKLSGYVPLR